MKRIILLLLVAALAFNTSCLRLADESGEVNSKVPDDVISTDKIATDDGDTSSDDEDPVTEESKDILPEPEPPKESARASFVGCGDNIIYYGTWRDAASKANGTGRAYSFRHIYKNVESTIASADIAFINQETICSQSFPPSSYPGFNSPVELTNDLADVGFDVVCLANNHMLDMGAVGLRDAYDNWNAAGLHVIGAYEEKDSGRYVTYYEKNGITVAFVAYTEFTNLYEAPANKGLYAPFLKQSDVAADIAEAEKNSDFVIVSVHWGTEGSFIPSDFQREYAQIMADNGADVILGHHPHVLQPIEWIKGEGGNTTLCAYSLGNFVHEQARDYNVVGGMLSFDIVKYGDGDAVIDAPLFTPTACHFPASFYDNTVYTLETYTVELCNEHAVRTYYGNTISLDGLMNYVKSTISTEFLPEFYSQ